MTEPPAVNQDLVLAALRRIRARLTDRGRWTRHVLARTDEGMPCDPTGKTAVCWCLLGAARVESLGRLGDGVNSGTYEALTVALIRTETANPPPNRQTLSSYNDNRGHAAVLDLIDAAIALRAKEST